MGFSSESLERMRTALETMYRSVRRRLGTGRVFASATLIGCLFLQWLDAAPVHIMRTRIFDFYQNLKPRVPPATPLVAVADIDEQSLAAFGQWPWPRTLVAELVVALRDAGAAAIGFDVVFAEPDRTSPEFVSRSVRGLDDATIDRLRELPRNDDILAAAIADAPVVLGHAAATVPTRQPIESAGWVPAVNVVGPVPDFLPRIPGLIRNLPAFEAAASGIGSFSLLPEADGIVRRVPAAFWIEDRVYPALALELLRVVAGSPSIDIRAGKEDGVNALRIRPHVIPTDRFGRIWVYSAPLDTRRFFSVADILSRTVGSGELEDRIVLVGTSASGLFDLRATPLEPVVPGVEVHAQALDMILTGKFIRRPGWARTAELLATFLAGVLVVALVPRFGAVPAIATGTAATGAVVLLSWLLFADRGILVDATWPLVTTVSLFVILVVGRYLREETEKRQIRSAFSQYLSPAVVEQLADSREPLQLGGETREMTMLFCDIRGFTSISESHRDNPQQLTALVSQLLTPLSAAVLEHRGTIDKYIGDCIMAFWNAPLPDEEHRGHACAAALDMVAAVGRVNRERGGEEPIRVGVGVNSGTVVVGNMGSDMRFDYSVLGDAVNLAARLEAQTKVYGVDIIVGEETAAPLGDAFRFLELDRIVVKGKSEGVRIYGLFDAGGDAGAFDALRKGNAAMLTAYRARRWREARDLAWQLRATPGMPPGYPDLMLERIDEYRTNPPPEDWNGVYVATTK